MARLKSQLSVASTAELYKGALIIVRGKPMTITSIDSATSVTIAPAPWWYRLFMWFLGLPESFRHTIRNIRIWFRGRLARHGLLSTQVIYPSVETFEPGRSFTIPSRGPNSAFMMEILNARPAPLKVYGKNNRCYVVPPNHVGRFRNGKLKKLIRL